MIICYTKLIVLHESSFAINLLILMSSVECPLCFISIYI